MMPGSSFFELGRWLVDKLYPEIGLWGSVEECRPRIAVVGFGKMGLLHSGLVGLLRPGSVAAVVDKSRLIVMGGSRLLPRLRFYTDLGKMLREVKPDAVYVTTPTEYHAEVVESLWDNGFEGYVFVEKPPARSLEEYEALARHRNSWRTMTGLQKRFAAPFRHLHALVGSGALGEIEEAYAEIRSSDILEPTSRYDGLGRGVLLDLGIHVVDLVAWLLGEPRVIRASYRSIYTRVDDYFEAELRAGKATVRLVATWSDDKGLREPRSFIELRGSRGWARATEDWLEAGLEEEHELLGGQRRARLYRPHYYQGVPPANLAHQEYSFEDMHFIESICMGREPETSLPRIAASMRTLERLYQEALHKG